MNKYLSYSKSKRLAELGYKPIRIEDDSYYWHCAHELLSTDTPKPIMNHYEILQDDWFVYPAPDCHDLLMELQKQHKNNYGFDFSYSERYEFHIDIYSDNELLFGESDANPVECLGQGLIKLLEEKQND